MLRRGFIYQTLSGVPAPIPTQIGLIYNKTTFTDLSDFTQTGGSVFSVSSGKIVNSINSYGGVERGLLLNKIHNFDKWKVTARYKKTANGSGETYGIYFGVKSVHPTGNASLYGTIADFDAVATLTDSYTAQNFQASGAVSNYAINSDNYFIVEKASGTYSVTASTVESGFIQSIVTRVNSYDFGGFNIGNIISKPCILLYSQHSYQIMEFTFESAAIKDNPYWLIGDSISWGSFAGSQSERLGELLGTEIYAGSGDKTSEALAALPVFLANVNPIDYNGNQVKVFIMLGINDKANGVSEATYISNLTSLKTQLETAGFAVRFITAPASSNYDMSGFDAAVASNFPTQYISGYTATKGVGTALDATYDAGDGTHINTAGNAQLASVIMASPLY